MDKAKLQYAPYAVHQVRGFQLLKFEMRSNYIPMVILPFLEQPKSIDSFSLNNGSIVRKPRARQEPSDIKQWG